MHQTYLSPYYNPQPPSYPSMAAYHNQVPAMPTTCQAQYYSTAAASGYSVVGAHAYGGIAVGAPSHPQYYPSPAAGFTGSGNSGYQMPAWAGIVDPKNLGSAYQVPATTTTPVYPSGPGFINLALLAPSRPRSPTMRTPPPPPPQAKQQPDIIDLTFDDDDEVVEILTEPGTIVPPFDEQLPNEATAPASTTEVAPQPAEPKQQARPKRPYTWLETAGALAELPNAKKTKMSDRDRNLREHYENQAAKATARFFVTGQQAVTPGTVVPPVTWPAATAVPSSSSSPVEGSGSGKAAPKKARGKEEAAAAAANKKAAGEGAGKKEKAPVRRKGELKEKMKSKKDAWKKGKVVEKEVVEAVRERARGEEEDDSDGLVDVIEGAFDDDLDDNTASTSVAEVAAAQKAAQDKEDEEDVARIEAMFDSDEEQVAGIDDLFESDEEVDSGELIVDENPLAPGEMHKS
jgi:hypothetical protein